MTDSDSSRSSPDSIAGSRSAGVSSRSLVSQFKAIWQRGEQIDVPAFLTRYAGAPIDKSAMLDLAYEEYCLRSALGQPIETDAFANRFPTIHRSLSRLLSVHRFLAANTDLFDVRGPEFWPEAGEDFLGFELVEELGRGAFARVFLARETALAGREVVVKVAQQGPAEAEMIAKLQHANIIPIYSVITDDAIRLTALCMPFKGRSTLGDLVDSARAAQRPLNIDLIRQVAGGSADQTAPQTLLRPSRLIASSYAKKVLDIAEQVASAIAYAHGKGICHQDLKPSNVLLSTSLEPLLLDFNLSADGRSPERIGGTLPYMAPEQLLTIASRHRASDVVFDPKSDVFSWAVLTWEVLSGELPFPAIHSPHSCQDMLESRKTIHLGATLDGAFDHAAFAVIRECLHFDPAMRPTADEVVRRLRKRHRLSTRISQWPRSRPREATLAGSAAVLLGLAMIWFHATRPPSSIRHYQAAQAYFREQRFNEAAAELNLSLNEHRSSEALYLRARVRLIDKDFLAAWADFDSTYKMTRQPELVAGMAFCRESAGEYQAAATLGEQAISAGCRTPEVYNNLGFAYLKIAHLQNAIVCFDKSIQLNSHLQAPLLNRARATLNLFRMGAAVDLRQAEGDIKTAGTLGSLSGDAWADAARLRIALRTGMPVDEDAIELLKKAVLNGFDYRDFFTDPIFTDARGFPPPGFFSRIHSLPHAVALATRLLDPMSSDFTAKSK